ncbi:MAG: cysteine desulfurase [Sulfurospirillum sp.]|nr:cysteine desulfurase [Sulfurospirillum sp.]
MIRDDFAFFNHSDLVYLDSASTTQKPKSVLEAMDAYNTQYCANIHRSSHGLGNAATSKYETAREIIGKFLHVGDKSEIIFTKGVTEGINLVAQSYAKEHASCVIISALEHHSNILPWQQIKKPLHVIQTKENLTPDLEHFESLLAQNPNALVALIHTSNAFGITHPIKEMIALAHRYGAKVLIDAAQSASHMPINISDLDADFLVISGHKLYGPTGIGALYIKKDLHPLCNPYQVGGGAIMQVFYDHTEYLPIPYMYESGTPNIAGAIGFGAAIEYLQSVGYAYIAKHEQNIIAYALEQLSQIEDILFYTQVASMQSNISFNISNIHHHDLGILLDKQKVQVRVGHHCVQPTMRFLGIDGTVRVSVGIYTNKADIDQFIKALKRSIAMLKG